METLSLKEVAIKLQMSPEGLRVKLANGEIPAAKIGRRWVILLSDLVEYIRSHYPTCADTSWGVNMIARKNICRSTKEAISGGLSSLTVEQEYNTLLERRIGN